MSAVLGGEIGKSDSYTVYAGSLDDPSAFHPTFAIFAAGRPDWAIIPPGLQGFRPDAGVVTAAPGLGRKAVAVRTRSKPGMRKSRNSQLLNEWVKPTASAPAQPSL